MSDEPKKMYAISIVTGEIFPIEEADVKLLFSYQIPLKTKPKSGCKKCYGRGYISIDSQTKLHHLCSCTTKCVADNYHAHALTIEMPRYQ